MGLVDTFLLDPARADIWIAIRTDGVRGAGTATDPYHGGASLGPTMPIVLPSTIPGTEILVDTTTRRHGFVEGDMVQIGGVTGLPETAAQWNRMFGIYDVTPTSFKIAFGFLPNAPGGFPTTARVTFLFDKILRDLPANTRVNLGPGVFQTRGYAPQGVNSWQPKAGQKIIGAGMDVTTLQLVGASVANQHYHAIGMNVLPSGSTPVPPLDGFEVSDLTIDCNLDNQPLRGTGQYTPVACGAVRVFGSHCRIHRVKAINWGSKTLKEGCFVLSVIDASAATTDASGQAVVQETTGSGIEDCVAIQPSPNCARETTVLHLGGLKNAQNQAQGFATAPFIRRNFVDGTLPQAPLVTLPPPSSLLITSGPGTGTISDFGPPTALFVGRRPHNRAVDAWLRFSNPRDPASKWNGYFLTFATGTDDRSLYVDLTGSQGTTDDSSLVIMGAEIRGMALTSCAEAVVEGNHVHNCWIGGPYASPRDDSISPPPALPALEQQERLDPLNALNIRSLIVRNNFYKNVAVGPYWNMGGVSGTASITSISYSSSSGLVTVTTTKNHHLWLNARVKIEFATAQPNFDGIREITPLAAANQFQYQAAPNLLVGPSGTASYRVVSGVDFLTIDGNVIELADLDATEFAIKEYPLTGSFATQPTRAFGIIVADNGLSPAAGPYVHRQVFIRNNKIRYVDGQKGATVAGLGPPAGAAMELAGIKQLHVTHNVVDLNAPNKLRTFRIGTARFFHNNRPDGEIIAGWKGDTDCHYDEPEVIAEDAFLLSMLTRRRR
jgi:hypothetical protein